MSEQRAEKVLRIALTIIIGIALIGVVLVIASSRSADVAVFELIAFSVSVTALVLATLSSINSIRQTRTMRKIARELHGAIAELRDIDHDNEIIKRKVTQDYKLAQDVADALAEAGIGVDEEERRHIAGKIEHTIRRNNRAE